ncbi:hypothetical protein K438DRAFT_1954216 [Mycena galopus ATCC 62051]|nr:hypothetical protein K438DRAFT_1954216 [Mycena galopus ATCC 62051]
MSVDDPPPVASNAAPETRAWCASTCILSSIFYLFTLIPPLLSRSKFGQAELPPYSSPTSSVARGLGLGVGCWCAARVDAPPGTTCVELDVVRLPSSSVFVAGPFSVESRTVGANSAWCGCRAPSKESGLRAAGLTRRSMRAWAAKGD